MKVALSILLGFVAACASTAEPAPMVAPAVQPLVKDPAPAPIEPQVAVSAPVALEAGAIASNGGTYGVRTSPAAGAPLKSSDLRSALVPTARFQVEPSATGRVGPSMRNTSLE